MARYEYRCPDPNCDNAVPAGVVEKRIAGSRGQARLVQAVFCESAAHASPIEMVRESYVPDRPEQSRRWG